MNDRITFTSDELDKLGPVTNKFCQAIAAAAALALAEFPSDIRMSVKYHLQDATSLFSPYTSDLTDIVVKALDDKK